MITFIIVSICVAQCVQVFVCVAMSRKVVLNFPAIRYTQLSSNCHILKCQNCTYDYTCNCTDTAILSLLTLNWLFFLSDLCPDKTGSSSILKMARVIKYTSFFKGKKKKTMFGLVAPRGWQFLGLVGQTLASSLTLKYFH